MNFKKQITPGTCAAMRCTTATTEADRTSIHFDPTNKDDATVHTHALCGKHFGLAVAEYGLASVSRPGALVVGVDIAGTAQDLSVVTSVAHVDTAEPAALALEGSTALEQAKLFAIMSQDDLSFAAELLQETKARAKYVLARKEAITKPLNAALKAARDLFRPAEEHFAEIERVFKAAIATFHEGQAAHNRAALAAAAEAFVEGDTAGVAAHVASMGSTANTDGIGMTYRFTFEIVDPSRVIRDFCSPDRAKITEYMRGAVEQCRAAGAPEEEIASLLGTDGVVFSRVTGVSVKS